MAPHITQRLLWIFDRKIESERERKSMGVSISNSCGVMYVWIRKTQSIYNALFMRFRWLQSKLYNRSTSVNQTKPKQPGQKKMKRKSHQLTSVRTYIQTHSHINENEKNGRCEMSGGDGGILERKWNFYYVNFQFGIVWFARLKRESWTKNVHNFHKSRKQFPHYSILWFSFLKPKKPNHIAIIFAFALPK